MKKLLYPFFSLAIVVLVAFSNSLFAQNNYKHPQINSLGQVMDENGTEFGWIKDGVIFNSKGEKVGAIEKQELVDPKGKHLGTISKEGTFYDPKGVVLFTIEPNSKGENCKVLDPQGKVIATVHEGYKNQACAFHCLGRKKS
jgi:hypothetical protein